MRGPFIQYEKNVIAGIAKKATVKSVGLGSISEG